MHQCCGSPFEPRVPTRRVANVRWGGVDLAALLDEIGIHRRARFLLVPAGLDGGDFRGTACDWYVKDLPLERLPAGGVLIAYELNGAPLPAEHGHLGAGSSSPGRAPQQRQMAAGGAPRAAPRGRRLFTTALYHDDSDAAGIAAGMPARQPVWAIAPEGDHRGTGARGGAGGRRAHRDLGVVLVVPRHRSGRGQRRRRHELLGRRFSRRNARRAWQALAAMAARPIAVRCGLGVDAFDVDGQRSRSTGMRNAVHTVEVVVR